MTQDEILKIALDKERIEEEELEFMKQIAKWTSFYRQNIHLFAQDYLDIKLKTFQKFLIYMLHMSDFSLLVMTRGIGKSWVIGVYACCLAILYPRSEIVIVSHTIKQARLIVEGKILLEIIGKSPRLEQEILKQDKRDGATKIIFKNGSTITPTVSSEAARGLRSTCIIIDESRLVDVSIVQSILQPTSHPRQAAYLDLPEFSGTEFLEESKDIYLSSAYYKVHPLYRQYRNYIAGMIDGKSVFTCALSEDMAVKNGLLSRKRLEVIKNEPEMSHVRYSMEYLTLFYGESEDAFFNLNDISNCKIVDAPYYCPSDMDFVMKKNFKTNPKKIDGEIRIISADIALRAGDENDASAYLLIRLLPNDEGKYVRQVTGIETVVGGHSYDQSLRLKQLYEDFQADYIVLDTLGSGLAVYDNLCRESEDIARGKVHKPMSCFNDEELKEKCKAPNPIPCIYGIRGSLQLNHECHLTVKDMIERNLLEFLIDTQDAKEGFLSKNYSIHSKTGEEQAFYLTPYIQTESLINEMINLNMEIKNGYVKLKETSSKARKDRYMSLAYANYFANTLEQDLDEDDDENWGSFWN